MKNKFIPFLFLMLYSICNAKYQPLLISQLIDNSDVIGIGEIQNVEKAHITVEFSELVKGKINERIIKIESFENWTCASRWTKYKKGQKIMFFLSNKNEKYKILGAGNKGELPIEGEKIYYKSLYGGMSKNSIKYSVYGSELYGISFTTLQLKNGIIEYLKDKSKFHKIAKITNNKRIKIENQFLKILVTELYTEIYQYE